MAHALASDGVSFLGAISGPPPGRERLSLRRSHAWTNLRLAKAWRRHVDKDTIDIVRIFILEASLLIQVGTLAKSSIFSRNAGN